MRRFLLLLACVVGLLSVAGVSAAPVEAAKPPWHGSYIQITKTTPDSVSARIRCPHDPNPDGSQHFFVGVTRADGSTVGYDADVAALCDMQRHQVTVPLTSGGGLVA